MQEYHINTSSFARRSARCPAMPLQEVLRAKDAWLVVVRDAGKPIPRPHYRPAIYQTV
jgi:hypothetical protein